MIGYGLRQREAFGTWARPVNLMARMSQIPSLDSLSALAGNYRRGFSIFPGLPGAEPPPVASQSRFVLGLSGQATSGRYFR